MLATKYGGEARERGRRCREIAPASGGLARLTFRGWPCCWISLISALCGCLTSTALPPAAPPPAASSGGAGANPAAAEGAAAAPLRIAIEPTIASDHGATQQPPAVPPAGDSAASGDRPTWTQRIEGHADFLRYSSPVSGIPFTKFVINPSSGEVYYFWTAIYPFHYNFVVDVLMPLVRSNDPEQGNGLLRAGQTGWDRLLVLGSIGYQNGTHGFEFLEVDTPSPRSLRDTYQRLKATFTGVDLRFRPISSRQQELAAAVPDVPWVGADFVTSAASFQCLNEGKAIGRLRVVEPGLDAGQISFDPNEIVVLDEVPMDITPVAGILAARLTTPLSHVNLRATAWGIPNAGHKNAHHWADPLENQIVYYQVRPTELTLRPATEKEQQEYESRRRLARHGGPLQVPAADLSFRGLPELEGLTAEEAKRVGVKAANLGVLATRGSGLRYQVPRGLAIPFSYYQDHMITHGLQRELKHLLDDAALRAEEPRLKKALVQLQQKIRAAPLDAAFRDQLLVRTRYLLGDRGLFVRSSTNAEDLPGFNGAGLYDTVPNVRGDEALVAAVKQVWASLWNYQAFRERDLFGIDHRAVQAGVILQVGIDADAAGVLITKDVFRPRARSGITINAKRGLGIRVVDGKRVPEQVLYDEESREIHVVSRSDDGVALHFDEQGGVREVVTDNREPVLGNARVSQLVAAAMEVRVLFPGVGPLDVEWLFEKERLYLVQARPYVQRSGQ